MLYFLKINIHLLVESLFLIIYIIIKSLNSSKLLYNRLLAIFLMLLRYNNNVVLSQPHTTNNIKGRHFETNI